MEFTRRGVLGAMGLAGLAAVRVKSGAAGAQETPKRSCRLSPQGPTWTLRLDQSIKLKTSPETVMPWGAKVPVKILSFDALLRERVPAEEMLKPEEKMAP